MAVEYSGSTVGQAAETMAHMTRTDLPAAWDERTTGLLRRLTIDTTRRYQPTRIPPGRRR